MSLAVRLMMIVAIAALSEPAAAHAMHSSPATGVGLSPFFALASVAVLYVIGASRITCRAGARRLLGPWQIAAMFGGLGVLAMTLMLHRLADRLVSVHMVQHLLVMLIASPLIVWGRPISTLSWGMPRHVRRLSARVGCALGFGALSRLVSHPLTVWILFSGSIAIWHLPTVYRLTLDNEVLHVLMHMNFLAAGLLFWSVILERSRKRRLDHGQAILFVFSTAMVTGLPGALLSFARRPIYHSLSEGTFLGMTALEDQQLAGLIMWIPMDLILFGVVSVLFVAWISESTRQQRADAAARFSASISLMLPVFLLLSGCDESGNTASGSDALANRGATLITQYGCGACHEIPGIRDASGQVGPSLERFGRRIYIAGMLPNSPDNLSRWLRDPQGIVPGNAMPNMNMSEGDAGRIATYLLALQ